jgi:hypothetical protein
VADLIQISWRQRHCPNPIFERTAHLESCASWTISSCAVSFKLFANPKGEITHKELADMLAAISDEVRSYFKEARPSDICTSDEELIRAET